MSLIRVLCVDDEPKIIDGLRLNLRRSYAVEQALNGAEGLELIKATGPFAVVLSDMQMPGMNGAAFLAQVRELSPDTTRMLLTGHADVQAAMAAVNQGQIFRFLTKPCPPPELLAAFDAAVRQHQLLSAERVLLEQTLLGSIKAMTDILALTSPLVFCRAMRIRQLVAELADAVHPERRWALEIAAMVSHLGYVAVSDEIVAREQRGDSLDAEAQGMVQRAAALTDTLLANIPRLDAVREILTSARIDAKGKKQSTEAAILRLVTDFDELESRAIPASLVLDTLRGRAGVYRERLLEELIRLKAATARRQEVREVSLLGLREGMVFAGDVRTTAGVLLVARGFRITASFLERTQNFSHGMVREPLRVIVSGVSQ